MNLRVCACAVFPQLAALRHCAKVLVGTGERQQPALPAPYPCTMGSHHASPHHHREENRARHRAHRPAVVAVYFVIFGAAVRPDGTPSGTLARRATGALALARAAAPRMFVASGGLGRHGPPEAHVVRELILAAGVPPGEILIEDRARDTLESIVLCHAILGGRTDVEEIVPCSSGYHVPRCALLFRLLGYRVRTGPMPPDRPHIGFAKWGFYVAKECLALPYDAALLLWKLTTGSVVGKPR